ncbi:hypothetical protein GW17_00001788 [Ensete ventricosum]|nr:hypothetical protein GW17_00001788 [Ensete ventricosum]
MDVAQPLPVASMISYTARCSAGSVLALSEKPVCGASTRADESGITMVNSDEEGERDDRRSRRSSTMGAMVERCVAGKAHVCVNGVDIYDLGGEGRWATFLTEWISRTVSNSIPVLSTDEIRQVEILRGILSISRGVKDMNEAWLAEVGLSPAPGGMFFPVFISSLSFS